MDDVIEESGPCWLFNLSNLIQDIGVIYQIYYCVNKKKNTDCISLDTQILFFMSIIARSIWVFDTELEEYALTYIELVLSYLVQTYFIVYVIVSRNESFIEQIFGIKGKFYEKWYFLGGISGLLGLLIHPSNRYHFWDRQILVSVYFFSEAVSLIPQIPVMFREKEVGSFTNIYIFFLIFSKFVRMIFWLSCWSDGKDYFYLIIADFINLVLINGLTISFYCNLDIMKLPFFNETKKD